jgi:hypothetical protein
MREQWERTRRNTFLIERFLGDDGMSILQTIALAYDSDIRQSSVLRLQKKLIHDQWENASKAVSSAITFLFKNCGVFQKEFIPYKTMLLPLAALAMEFDLSDHSQEIKRWFWSQAFGQAYDVAANTRVVRDYKALKKSFVDPDVLKFSFEKIEPETIFESTRKTDKAIWSGFLCALLASSPTGIGDAPPNTIDNLDFQFVPVSIFTKSAERAFENSPHLRVLSLILASKTHVQIIKKKGFLPFLEEETISDTALVKQFFPPRDELNNLTPEDIMEFRLNKLLQFLHEQAPIEIGGAPEDID